VARIKKAHSFELISGERRGNTTAPNRSTVIGTRLSIDMTVETSFKKGGNLEKALRRGPNKRS